MKKNSDYAGKACPVTQYTHSDGAGFAYSFLRGPTWALLAVSHLVHTKPPSTTHNITNMGTCGSELKPSDFHLKQTPLQDHSAASCQSFGRPVIRPWRSFAFGLLSSESCCGSWMLGIAAMMEFRHRGQRLPSMP